MPSGKPEITAETHAEYGRLFEAATAAGPGETPERKALDEFRAKYGYYEEPPSDD